MSDLPQGWSDTTIGEVTLPFVSIDPTKEPTTEFRYVDIGSIDKSTQTIGETKTFAGQDAPSRARRVIHEGDVLFSTVRTYLKNIAAVPEHLDGALTSTGIAVLRASAAIESRYLFNWVCSDEFVSKMSGAQDGTLYPAVTDKDVSGANIPLPPLPEQRRIVAKVDGLTARTARARKDLDRIPTLIARYKRVLLGQTFERLAEEHGKVPLADLTTKIGSGATPRGGSSVYVDVGTPFIRSQNVYFEGFDYDGMVYIDDGAAKALANVKTEGGDVLLNITGASIGRATILPNELVGARVNQHVSILRCKHALLNSYLLHFLWSPEMQKLINDENYGVTRQALTKGMIENFAVPLPSLAEQAEIVRRIEAAFGWLDRMAADRAAAARLLPKLDAAILAKAFRGELVPQDPNDEPASVLLDRIKAERAAAPKVKRGRQVNQLSRPKELQTMAKNLEQVLAEAGDWLPAQEAFQQCGIGSSASTEEIENIFAELRKLDKAGKIDAEPVNDDQGRKLYDRLRLRVA